MRPQINNDPLYLLGILESVGKIQKYTASCANAESFYFLNEQLNFNAALNLLANIGELSAKVSSELKDKYPEILWKDIKNFRNRVVHDYAGLNIYIVFKIIENELPVLKNKITEIINREIAFSTFDKEEIKAAKNSIFYSHIDFEKFNL